MKKLSPKSNRRLSILHLGFEDYRQPGSGGGAIRTHEINKRLARHHDITVLTSCYKGGADRVEDGVRYVHIGQPWGYFGSILTYFAAVPFAARKYKADLIVEDFAAPFSSCLTPLWTRRPVVAMVQWLNAKEKSKQYHLPFWLIEKIGLRLQKYYIAVSEDLATQIREVNPKASVAVIGNGVPRSAFNEPLGQKRRDIIYIGRIERAQKGLDLLLDSYAKIAGQTKAQLILIGDGTDESWVRSKVNELGLSKRVVLLGRVNGQKKHAALAQAKVVAMPSRFETFGMVAIEALAGGSPVVAYDIACLREVVPAKLGKVIPPFDTTKFSNAMLELLNSRSLQTDEVNRREFAFTYDWDKLAAKQQLVYESMVASLKNTPISGVNEGDELENIFAGLARTNPRKGRKAKVVIIGNYGNGNTGDEAILARIGEVANAHVDLCVFARDASIIHNLHGLPAVDRLSAKGVLSVLKCDVVAIGGGGMFGSGMPFLVRALPYVALALSLFGKKIVFVAIGAYPNMPKTTAAALRLLAKRAHVVTVREALTAEFFSGGRRPLSTPPVIISDPGISLTASSVKEVAEYLGRTPNELGNSRLVISLKPAPDSATNKALVKQAATAINWWVEIADGHIDFLCLSSRGDFGHGAAVTDKTLSQEAKALCSHSDRVTILEPNLPPRIAKGLIASATGVIGARLHAQIFAHATNTPVFGLVFELKSRQFLSDIAAPYITVPSRTKKPLYQWLTRLGGSTQGVAS